jgi:hypothetical protein
MNAATSVSIGAPGPVRREELLEALGALDRLLENALELARSVYGWAPDGTRFRGLFIAQAEVEQLLGQPPAAPTLKGATSAPFHSLSDIPRLTALSERYGLDWFDRAVLLIALAPELDLRYERVYAYLQDDVTRRRPTVDLILNLLAPDAESKIDRRTRFASDVPLVRAGLIHLLADPNQTEPSLLSRFVKLDAQVVRELLGTEGLDTRLGPFAECIHSELALVSLPLLAGQADALRRLAFRSRAEGIPLRLAFRGAPMPLKRRAAEALAGETGRTLLSLDADRVITSNGDVEAILAIAIREAELSNSILFIALPEASVDQRFHRAIADALGASPVDAIVACVISPSAFEPLGFVEVEFSPAPFETRRLQWKINAAARRIPVGDCDLDSLAERFRLHPDQIESAVTAACGRARWRGDAHPTPADMAAAARAQSGHRIGELARKIEPIYGWDDIVLPAATVEQLRAICGRVDHRHRVLDDWGFDRKLSMGKGVTALFAGPSGVGKTMAAEIIARELELDLYKIDLSGVVSKYIGETEKNLERIFAAAENANVILFFDEADALFGKRSEVRDSHDRYANIEISYLLQKMEMYDGVAILASNLRQNLDESFVRRLAFTIHFPFPDQAHRRRIWAGIWPAQTPLDAEVDLDFLAAQFKLSGGNIKNVALAAAFLAAETDSAICMRHLLIAVEREYQKMSKPVAREQFGRWAPEAQA